MSVLQIVALVIALASGVTLGFVPANESIWWVAASVYVVSGWTVLFYRPRKP